MSDATTTPGEATPAFRGRDAGLDAAIDAIDVAAAAERIRGVVRETPLEPFALPELPQVELRLKLECLQEVGAFKARGAWNQIECLDEASLRRLYNVHIC